MLREYDSKSFLSVNEADLGLESEEEKEELEKKTQENKELLDFVKETLNGAIVEAKISNKLKSHAVCLVSTGGISLEMEKYFELLPGEDKPKAERVLELNAAHASFTALKNAFKEDKEKAAKYAEVLYAQALLIAGLPLEDPARYTELVTSLIV